MRRYRQTSPERTKVWNEKSPKYCQNRKVPVVYYLCKNRHLEHPHFIEVPFSSPDGLYLRDVVYRLDDLRGRGLHLKYSWSSKRSYKTGYVWHDLSEDDLIVPVNGHEYILKGSELFEDNRSGCVGPSGSINMQALKQLPEPDSAKSRDDSSSASSRIVKGDKCFQEDEYYLSDQHPGSGHVSSGSRLDGTCGSGDTLNLVGYKDGKNRSAADASTQTEENVIVPRFEDAETQSGSGSSKCDYSKMLQNCIALERQNSAASSGRGLVPSSSKSSARRKASVADLLNKADAKATNSFRIHEKDSPSPYKLHPSLLEEDVHISSSPRLKVTDMFIPFISCGSIHVKGHSFGVAHSNRPRYANTNSPSSWYSNSTMTEELNCVTDNTRFRGMHVEEEDKGQHFESTTERKTLNKGDRGNSSFNSSRSCRQLNPVEHKFEPDSLHMISLSESLRSALSVRSKIPTDNYDTKGARASNKRTTYPHKKPPSHIHPSIEQSTVITTEERLSSGARVIIHSRASLDIIG